MSETIQARDLRAGDYIAIPQGIGYFHRVPLDRSQQFTAHYLRTGKNSKALDGFVTYEPDEEVQVLARWPFVFGMTG